MKKVLILYATYGTGHRSVANYIQKYLTEKDANIEVCNIDLLDYAMPVVGKWSRKINEHLMSKHPKIWSAVYKMTNGKISSGVSMKISMNMLKNKRLQKVIESFNPDLCIATHFFGTSLIAYYKRKKIIQPKLITIVTDYEAHEMWLRNYEANDYLIVSSKEEKDRLIKKGIPEDLILVNGIPICLPDTPQMDRKAWLKSYGLSPEKLTCIFFAGGGNGSKASLHYLKKIMKDQIDMNVIFVSGKSAAVQERALKYQERYHAKQILVLGYVTNVPELLQIVDFVITKPGGLQITESLYAKKPVMLINGNGGQENANHRYFVKAGYGKRFRFAASLSFYLKTLVEHPELLEDFVEQMKKADSKAMESLYQIIESLL